MSGVLAVLALAAQVVTLEPAVIAEKAVYVRVAVGTDSRIAIADGMVRVHGQHATAEMLGLKLGYARPTTLLLLHPRSSGLGEIKFIGLKHTMRLRIEASTLGEAQDLEIRIAQSENKADASKAPEPAPPRAPAPATASVAPEQRERREATADLDGAPTPPPPRLQSGAAAQSHRTRRRAATPAAQQSASPRTAAEVTTAAPQPTSSAVAELTPPEPRADVTAVPPAPAAPAAAGAPEHSAPSAEPGTTAATCPTGLMSTTKRLMRRVGRPGQRGILLEELRREGAQLTLRARVEGAAEAQFVQLALSAFAANLTAERDGRDLVVSGTVTPTPTVPVRNATLVIDFGGHWETAHFHLPEGGTL